jgi:hypothetical protein
MVDPCKVLFLTACLPSAGARASALDQTPAGDDTMKRWSWMLVAVVTLGLAVGSVMAAGEAAPVKAAPTATAAAPTATAAAPTATAAAPTATVAAPTATVAAPTATAAAPTATVAAPTATAPAATSTAESESKKAFLADLALMTKECKLSDEQVAKMKETQATAEAESEKWEKVNGDKIEAAQKAYNAAVAARDQTALRKAMEDSAPLVAEIKALRAKYQTAFANILTEEQKNSWKAFLFWRNVKGELEEMVGLTEEQATKMRPLCDAAATQISALKQDDPDALAKSITIQNDLRNKIRDTILTADQKKKLEAMMAPLPPLPPIVPAPTPTAAPAPVAPKAEK